MNEYLSGTEQVLAHLQTTPEGLRPEQAEARLAQNGRNKLKEGKKTPLILKFLHELTDPMIIILMVAAAISGVLAVVENESFADVIIIMAVVVLNAVLGVFQESKAEKAIAALQQMTAAHSKVLRGGQLTVIPSEELVTGDVVLLEAGDAVPADVRILESASLQVEEAALTGESVPVTKVTHALHSDTGKVPLGDRKNMAYMGSTVVYGRGKAVVTACGMDTEMGKIADALDRTVEGDTPLQKKLAQLSRFLTYMVLGISAVIFIVGVIRSGSFEVHQMLDTFMVAVSLAVAAIPEGLAAVVTIVLSIGVTNMSRRNAVIRRLTAVETLGCAGIICSDKTGTLTQNKMTVVDWHTSEGQQELLAQAMALASDAEPDESGHAIGEPTECALVNFAASLGLPKPTLTKASPRISEAPFDSMRKMMSTVHRTDRGIIQYTKGAPDEVLKRCTGVLLNGEAVPMTDELRASILQNNKAMADRALRVLCAATRTWAEPPASAEPDYLERDLCFIGLVGMIDPVRPEVKAAIDKCRTAGIRPVMITGDHRDTAVAIALELGIITDPAEAITGAQLDDISEEDLTRDIGRYAVYARVQPEHKVRIVRAWRARGEVTAMTGDGVNDAPSIKSADIGVGMGITGTDVTKNVADMVLADDNFATIVSAVEEGRRIYDNIRKTIQFLLASNLSEVLVIFAATMIGFSILRPVHLLWINLITDSIPAVALGMEQPEGDIMRRPPRNPREGVFAGRMLQDIVIHGAYVGLITFIAYAVGHFFELGNLRFTDSEHGTTMAFLTLSMAEIFHSFNLRSRLQSIFTIKRQNVFLWGAMALSFILTTAVIYVPVLNNAFRFTAIKISEYLIALGIALTVIPFVELYKAIRRARQRKDPAVND